MTRIASTAPIMIITMIIATIPYITVVFEAKPVSGVAVGTGVAADELAEKADVEDDGQYALVPSKFAYTV